MTSAKRSGGADPLAPRGYGIELLRLFRGGQKAAMALAREGLLWTPSHDGLCGVTFREGIRYLVTGSLHGAKPWVSTCGFVRPWAELTRKQRKGFQRLYEQGCRCSVSARAICWRAPLILPLKTRYAFVSLLAFRLLLDKYAPENTLRVVCSARFVCSSCQDSRRYRFRREAEVLRSVFVFTGSRETLVFAI